MPSAAGWPRKSSRRRLRASRQSAPPGAQLAVPRLDSVFPLCQMRGRAGRRSGAYWHRRRNETESVRFFVYTALPRLSHHGTVRLSSHRKKGFRGAAQSGHRTVGAEIDRLLANEARHCIKVQTGPKQRFDGSLIVAYNHKWVYAYMMK